VAANVRECAVSIEVLPHCELLKDNEPPLALSKGFGSVSLFAL